MYRISRKKNSWHYGFMASRSTKYTSLLSRCHLPDDSQRAIHNQSTIERSETFPVWVQKIFSNGSGNRSRIPENLFYNSIPIIHASKCAKTSIRGEKKQCASRYYCDITLKICIHNRVEILTRGLQSIFRNMYDYF